MTPADIRTQADMHYQHPVLAPLLHALADVVQSLGRWPHPADCKCARCEALARVEAL